MLKLAKLAAQEEKQEDEERPDIKKLLKQLRKDRKHEDEARALLKQVQINLEEAQARSAATNYGVRPVRRVHAGTRTVGSQTSSGASWWPRLSDRNVHRKVGWE